MRLIKAKMCVQCGGFAEPITHIGVRQEYMWVCLKCGAVWDDIEFIDKDVRKLDHTFSVQQGFEGDMI